MTDFKVSNKTLSAIRNFLADRPFREVANLINTLDEEIRPQLDQKESEVGSSDKKAKKAS